MRKIIDSTKPAGALIIKKFLSLINDLMPFIKKIGEINIQTLAIEGIKPETEWIEVTNQNPINKGHIYIQDNDKLKKMF